MIPPIKNRKKCSLKRSSFYLVLFFCGTCTLLLVSYYVDYNRVSAEINDDQQLTKEIILELPEIPEQNNNCESEGVIPTITGVMGTLQANEVVNSILNFNSNMEKKMIVFNSIKMSFRTIHLSRNKNCSNKC